MILEQTEGDVLVTLEGKRLVVGTNFDDSKYSMVVVTGIGKAIFRVDSNTTNEINAISVKEAMSKSLGLPERIPEPVVEAAPVAARVTPAVETPSEPAEET
jgi:hypothetical protein